MSSATMTVLGMYNVIPDLFDDLTFPAGINKETAVDEILLRSGEFEVLYSNPAFLKTAITHWGKKHYRTFEEWVRALAINFDPLYNYDRFEEYTDAKVSNGSVQSNGKTSATANNLENDLTSSSDSRNASSNEMSQDAENSNGTSTGRSFSATSSDSSGSDGKQRDVSAYDSSTYEPREKETGSSSSRGSGDGIAMNENAENSSGSHNTVKGSSQNETGEHSETSGRVGHSDNSEDMSQSQSSNSAEQTKHTAHLYGNIGLTTSSQMLEDFLRVERFTIYEEIADIFVNEFCIMVY